MATLGLTINKRLNILLWIGIAGLLVFADYLTSPLIQFPFTFIIPIALASWYNGRKVGIIFAVVMACTRLIFFMSGWNTLWSFSQSLINSFIRLFVFLLFAILVDRTARQTRQLSQEVKLLKGLLPICSGCKKIRNEHQEWQKLESYVMEHTDAKFTHSLCPDCAKIYFPGVQVKK